MIDNKPNLIFGKIRYYLFFTFIFILLNNTILFNISFLSIIFVIYFIAKNLSLLREFFLEIIELVIHIPLIIIRVHKIIIEKIFS